jgi:hypothetical protein
MDVRVSIHYDPYTFNNYWVLEVKTEDGVYKRFFLGNPQEFCYKVLGVPPTYVIERVGVIDFRKVNDRRKLGRFVANKMKLNNDEIESINEFEFGEKYLV